MVKRTFFSLSLALTVVSLLPGCGGGKDASVSKAAETGPLTKAEFIKEGDEICRKADVTQTREARAYRKEHEKELAKLAPIPAEEKLIVAITLPSIRQQMKELEALGAPKGEEKKLESFVAGIEAGLRRAAKNPYHVEWEYPSQNPFLAVDEALTSYGFAYCSNPA
jgi:hypothetical protein